MKIKLTNPPIRLYGRVLLRLFMKCMIFLFCSISFAFSPSILEAQNAEVVIDSDMTVNVKQVLRLINKQTDYKFIYRHDLVSVLPNVELKKGVVKAWDLLDQTLLPLKFTYDFTNSDTIVLKKIIEVSSDDLMAPVIQFQLRGTVTDVSGAPLPGATILEKGTSNGTQSDFDGKFNLKVSGENAVLVVSYIGFATKEIVVAGQDNINIIMEESAASLEEIVLVGYGSQKKSDLTGAISSLGAKDLTSGGATSNVAQAMQGRAAGVVVTQNSKAPGGSMSIRIRGSNSVSSTNEPLYVVDGFPTDNGININPDDIASMEILKDASATAIYGSRGANGVVLITTKRGKAGQGEVFVSAYTTTQSIVNPFNMLSGRDYMLLANSLYKEISGQENQENGVYTPSQLQSDINTDWIDVSTRNSLVQNYSFQITGGSEKTKILTSIGYFDQEGILKNTNFSRFSGRVNLDHQVNDFFKSGVSIMAQREKSNYQIYDGNILNSNVLYSILTYDPTVSVYNADGTFARPPGGRGDNPVANLYARQNDLQKDTFNGSLYLEFLLAEGLRARINGGTEIRHDQLRGYLSKESYQGSIDDGVANISDYSMTHNLFDMFITYDKAISKHALQLMGGYSYEKYINQSKGVNVYGFSTDLFSYNNLGAASTITGVSSGKSENILASFFSRVNYSFDNKYLATFTVRADGSSRFGEDNKWGYFPSGSFAWRVINESFMRDQNTFSDLKFRMGYGKTGNERIGNYASYGLTSNAKYTFDGDTNSSGVYLNNTSPENSRLKWETTDQYNVGLDFNFFNDRLKFNLDAYYKKTDNLLIKVNLPMYTGYTSGLSNIGAIENKGFEFGVESINFMTDDFTWTSSLNFAVNRNRVLSLGEQSEILLTSSKPIGNVSEEAFAIIRKGEALGSLFGYEYIGIIQEGETYAPQPNAVPGDPKFRDVNNDGEITSADRTIIGSAYPKLTFGFTNTFEYKGFDLSIFIYGKLGNDLLNMTRMNLEWNRTQESLDRWTPSNQNASLPRNGFFYSQYGGYINSHFIEDASFIRLRNVTLGYNLPLKSNHIKDIRLYVIAENLFTITNYSGWDPEVDTKGYENDNLVKYGGNAQSANAGAGLDFNSYPNMRSFTLGISAKF